MSKDKNVVKRLAGIEAALSEPIPEAKTKPVKRKIRKVTKMAKAKKKVAKAPVKKVVKKVATKAAPAKAAKESASLSDLAKAAGLDGQQARYKLRKAGIDKPEGRFWVWTRKSDIKKVQKALAA